MISIGYIFVRFILRDKLSNYDKISRVYLKVVAGLTLFMAAMVIYHIKPAMMTADGGKGELNPAIGTINLIGVPYGNNSLLNFTAWLQNALFFPGLTILCLCVFLPFRTGKLLNKWINLPISILEFGLLFNLINALNGTLSFDYKTIFIALTVGLNLALSISYRLDSRADSRDMNWKECLNMIGLFIIAIIAFAPIETLAVLNSTNGIMFGREENTLRVYDLNELHRFILYIAIIYAVAIYFLFRNCNKNVRKTILLILSLGALRVFTAKYGAHDMFPIKDGVLSVSVNALPLHLCHTALYVVPLCIAIDSKKLFYFTYFINVFGAFCAILMPNTGENLNVLSPAVVAYWYNHFAAFGMPLLCVALHVFERPKFKQMLWSLLFFTFYFVLVMFLNAWFSNYVSGGTDYLFINGDFILTKIMSDKDAANMLGHVFTWKWGDLTFTIRPLYQGIFFAAYAALAFVMWFVYSLFFRIADSHYELHCLLVVARKENITMKERRKIAEEVVDTNEVSLVFENFTKRYGNSPVLSADQISLKVEGGHIFGFLGPNGAGKSTCIKSAIGIQPVTDGHIFACGYDVTTQPVQTKKLIGYVPDHYALYEKLTGREYINYIADLYGVSKEDRDIRIAKYVDLFELHQAFDNRMQTYSHGMKQKITIMAALVHNPKIWILDEPLTGLDPQSIFQVKECMKAHAAEGNIVFFSSHIIDVVEKLCTRIAIVKKGHIVYQADMTEVAKEHPEGLETFYLSMIHDNGDLDD